MNRLPAEIWEEVVSHLQDAYSLISLSTSCCLFWRVAQRRLPLRRKHGLKAFIAAAGKGDVSVLRRLYTWQLLPDKASQESATVAAAKGRHFHVLNFLQLFKQLHWQSLSAGAHLDVFRWCLPHAPGEHLLAIACEWARQGHLALVESVLQLWQPPTGFGFQLVEAALRGHIGLSLLQCPHFPTDDLAWATVCAIAVTHEPAAARWLVAQKKADVTDTPLSAADGDTVTWLVDECGCSPCQVGAFLLPEATTNVEYLKWLHSVCTEPLMFYDCLGRNPSLEVLRWVLSAFPGLYLRPQFASKILSNCNRLDVITWMANRFDLGFEDVGDLLLNLFKTGEYEWLHFLSTLFPPWFTADTLRRSVYYWGAFGVSWYDACFGRLPPVVMQEAVAGMIKTADVELFQWLHEKFSLDGEALLTECLQLWTQRPTVAERRRIRKVFKWARRTFPTVTPISASPGVESRYSRKVPLPSPSPVLRQSFAPHPDKR
jgi:hypothetical protein